MLFAKVRLFQNLPTALTYEIPPDWQTDNLVGAIVRAPLRAGSALGIIEEIETTAPGTFKIRQLLSQEPFPNDPQYLPFLEKLAHYQQIHPADIIRRLSGFLYSKAPEKETLLPLDQEPTPEVTLTSEQSAVVDYLSPAITTPQFLPTLLHGVTGSGKTEVYTALIRNAITAKKSALLLLPEVTLALQFEQLLIKKLGAHVPVFSFHSATKTSQKKNLWHRIINNEAQLIIGVHQPVLLPLKNLAIIIIDEEHETGYQEKKHPKINSKDAAILRAQTATIPVLLGSATPSISSLYNVEKRGWKLFTMRHRFGGTFPEIQIVSLKDKKEQRRHFWITKELHEAIRTCLLRKEQAIIFINRRGFSFFVQCKNCTTIINCSSCSVSLTLHEDGKLTCHYCGFSQQKPNSCPHCAAPESELTNKGLGTQQVVTILKKLFPNASIARADLDTTSQKREWTKTVEDFQSGAIDILVGTQTITKGYHFPRVTLVGILWADLNIHFPVYNAAETALQQLIQVAGRAGRGSLPSKVIVQTMADHPIFDHLTESNYLDFYKEEIENRHQAGYPPALRLAEIELKNKNEAVLSIEAEHLAITLQKAIDNANLPVKLLGPARPPVHKIKREFSLKMYLKGPNSQQLAQLYAHINCTNYKSSIFFTPNSV